MTVFTGRTSLSCSSILLQIDPIWQMTWPQFTDMTDGIRCRHYLELSPTFAMKIFSVRAFISGIKYKHAVITSLRHFQPLEAAGYFTPYETHHIKWHVTPLSPWLPIQRNHRWGRVEILWIQALHGARMKDESTIRQAKRDLLSQI